MAHIRLQSETRRPASTREAKLLNAFEAVVVFDEGSAGMFLALVNRGDVKTEAIKRAFAARAAELGMEFEVIATAVASNGRPCVQFILTVPTVEKAQVVESAVVNKATVRVRGFVVVRPVNLSFAPKPRRIATLAQFVQAKGWVAGEGAFVDRLFDEGMLERNAERPMEFRPTAGGRVWFAQHQGV